MFDKLNIGCGKNWRDYPGYEGLDLVDYGQKYVGNVLNILPTIKPTTFSTVMANHFLEHFSQDEVREILNNCHAILKPGGLFKIVVPHKDQPGAYSLVHRTYYSERTFLYLGEAEFCQTYKFNLWQVKSIIVNERPDIHCELVKI